MKETIFMAYRDETMLVELGHRPTYQLQAPMHEQDRTPGEMFALVALDWEDRRRELMLSSGRRWDDPRGLLY